ncbi:MAG: PaaI family thioesterase [Novosphingobium sp.]
MSSAPPSTPQLRLTIDEVAAFLDAAFPPETRPSLGEVDSLEPNRLRLRLDPLPAMRRPGNIVSGPTLMGLVDVATYGVIAAHHGAESMAVTNALSIVFLRPCRFEPIFADAHLLKLGRRLATVDVRVWQEREDRLVAQSTVGYAIP